ncbi:DUF2568 domain-containing protein [Cohnella endophytica]|uniref:DUF2568 domain-containing protein n=1 Tax=Cohnella endophytica TaxID=2419778 RepID=A0A494XH75_9BACL|nr:YrdB family protein [Cohnella endophytica]RKP47966.1 DUF2568 domain-containing protein [Cohnella endophytica]
MKSTTTLTVIVLTYMFMLELASLAAFGVWGFRMNVFAGIGIPLVILVLWSMFLAPKASIPVLSYPIRTVLKLVVFLLASAALFASGYHTLAGFLAVTSVADIALIASLNIHVWNPTEGARNPS